MTRLLLAVLLILVMAPVAGAATGSISGTVTDRATGAPVAGGCVFLFTGESTAPFVDPSTQTAADGTYSFTGLETGSAYRVEFAPYSPFFGDYIPANACFSGVNYFSAWFKDADGPSTATRISVTDGAATTGIDQQLDHAASIGGRVTNASRKPVSRACVTLDGGSRTTTDPDGRYEFEHLGAGTFGLAFGVPGSFFAPPAMIPCGTGYAEVKQSYTLTDGQQITDADIVLPVLPRPGLSADALCQPIQGSRVRCQVHGVLRPNASLSDIARRKLCSGAVTVRATEGKKRLANVAATITRTCRYGKTFTIRPAHPAQVVVRVRYAGNAYNAARSAKPQASVFPID